MILLTAAGFLLQRFAGVTAGTMIGLLGGVLVAQFIPRRRVCALPVRATEPD